MATVLLTHNKHRTDLLVDGNSFLMLAGEACNSSSSSLAYMEEQVWPCLRQMQLNTLLVSITWELLEPTEGNFDFSILDGLLAQARRENVRLVLLWFGLWKNGESTYIPSWVKADKQRYFPMRNRYGQPFRAISPFCAEAVAKDQTAFCALLYHLKQVDRQRTVLFVQLENEMGLLGDVRDFSPVAEAFYTVAPPAELLPFGQPGTSWEESFGEDAPEMLMVWGYARAVQQIAAAAKATYDIPLYVNAWLEQFPWTPGTYPCGGPIARMLPVWKTLGPSIDFFAPDIYLADFDRVCTDFSISGNPLFIPEARPSMDSASNAFSAFGKHHALGFSPFAIEHVAKESEPPAPSELDALNIALDAFNHKGSGTYLRPSYAVLAQLLPLLAQNRGTAHLKGFTQHLDQGELIQMEQYDFHVSYYSRTSQRPKGGGLILELNQNTFLLAGLCFRAEPLPKRTDRGGVELIALEEGQWVQDHWERGRRLNGDELHIHFTDTPNLLLCVLAKTE